MVHLLASISQFLFVLASFAQARKCYVEGHAEGLSITLIWSLIIGFSIMIYYTIVALNSNAALMSGYIGQLVCLLFMARYKHFPR